jgi:hypothetical protein
LLARRRLGGAAMMRFEEVIGLWREGERRLARAQPEDRAALARVTEALVVALRRRLGGTFTAQELVNLYAEGTDWCFDVATRVAPDNPAAWDMSTVTNAAFARYLREASDYAGGRRIIGENDY